MILWGEEKLWPNFRAAESLSLDDEPDNLGPRPIAIETIVGFTEWTYDTIDPREVVERVTSWKVCMVWDPSDLHRLLMSSEGFGPSHLGEPRS